MTIDFVALAYGVILGTMMVVAWLWRRVARTAVKAYDEALTGWKEALTLSEDLLVVIARYQAMFENIDAARQQEEGNDPQTDQPSSYLH